ncbi:MAG: hypothetical protein CMJ72_02130 [Planctomycetaceae bacterium]|nr:hypothetical protein [Planctomycetaceae bacterium]MCH2594633.1 prolipoprotein diacylglyceryl transferase [Pirellulales bacterium]HCK41197.1 hypothetical protein [Planctomycetaceae bacterium]
MCSELFRIPLQWLNHSIGGVVPVKMLLVLLLVCLGLGILGWCRRNHRASEAWGYLPGLFILAVGVMVLPQMFPGGLPIRGYGVMVLLGSLSGIGLAMVRARQMNLNPDIIFSLAFGMFVCGIIGARLFYVIEYWDTRFQFDDWPSTFLAIVKFTEGGLVVYGSLIGATVAFLWFMRRQRLPALAMADLIAPSLLVGLAFGRIGCLLNGCCYGGESHRPWTITFPAASMLYSEQVAAGRMHGFELVFPKGSNYPEVVRVDEGSPAAKAGLTVGSKIDSINQSHGDQFQKELLQSYDSPKPLVLKTKSGQLLSIPSPKVRSRSLPVHPAQVYSAVNAILLAWVLWTFYAFRRRDGEVTALMLTIYPISRFLLEMIRIDESAVFGTGLSISQNISLVLLLVALGMWISLRRKTSLQATFA